MKRSPISLIHVFTFLLAVVTLCFIGLSTISSRGIDRVGTHAATEVSNNISHINQHGEKIELQLATFVESSEKVANIASQQRELITTYQL